MPHTQSHAKVLAVFSFYNRYSNICIQIYNNIHSHTRFIEKIKINAHFMQSKHNNQFSNITTNKRVCDDNNVIIAYIQHRHTHTNTTQK